MSRKGLGFHNRRSPGISPTQQAINRILALPGLEAAYFPYIPGLTQPFVGTTNASSWPDSSGKNRPLLQATAVNQPTIAANGSLIFDGIQQWMKTAPFALSQPETFYYSFKQLSWTANDRLFDGNASYGALIDQIPGTPILRATTDGGVHALQSALQFPVGTYATLVSQFNGASSLIQVDGNAPIAGDMGAGNAGGFTVGSSGLQDGGYGNLQAACIVITSVVDSAAKIAQTQADILTLRLAAGIT